MVWPAITFIAVLFVLPTCYLLAASFSTKAGALTISHYVRLFGTPLYVGVLLGTLKTAFFTTLICIAGAYPVSYLLANHAGNRRGLLLLCVLMPFWTSMLVRCFAWMVILGRQGLINHGLISAGFIGQPLELMYSSGAVLVGMSHALMPVAILTMLSVMDNIDRTLMRAAATVGAKPGNAFWRVYFPLSQPGVVAAGLLVFVSAIGFFITPILLGGPDDMMLVQVIVTQMDELLNWGFAGALAVLLLGASLLLLVIFDRFVGLSSLTGDAQTNAYFGRPAGGVSRRLYAGLGWATVATMSASEQLAKMFGRSRRGRSTEWKIWLVASIVIVFLAAPSFVLVPISFSKNPFIAWPPRGVTFDWYQSYFASPVWQFATIRSAWIAILTGILSLILGVPAAFALARRPVRARRTVIAVFVLPMVMPHIIIAVGLFYLYAQLGLLGTTTGIVLGHTIFALPYVTITLLATLRTYDTRLDQAAATLGARPLATFRLITLPIIRTGMITAFVFAFVKSFDELTVALFVAGGASATLPRQIWAETLHNVTPTIAAASTILLAVIAVAIFITEWLSREKHRA